MELIRIEELLDKYFDGNLNESEEDILRDYFLEEKVANHLTQYQSLFGFFAKERDVKSEKEIMINSIKSPKKNNKFLFSIAASVIVLVGISVFIFNHEDAAKQNDLGTFDDPKVALRETQKALTVLSKHVNTGYESVQVIEEYELTKNKIFNVN